MRLAIFAIIVTGCAVTGCASLPLRDIHGEAPANVVLIYMDNVGYGDLGSYGNRDVLTPHLDRLATEGVRATDFYVSTSSCSPSRGALLTGRYPLRNGLVHQLVNEENRDGVGLPHRERILPQYLAPLGYTTGAFGKWNIGFAPGSRPTDRGFQEFFGHQGGNINYFTYNYNGRRDLFRGTNPDVDAKGYSTDLFASAAVNFIARHKDRPFFLYLPFNAAHFLGPHNMAPGEAPIWQVPDRVFARYGLSPDEGDPKKRYRAVVTALDEGIGRVLAAIDAHDLRDRTLVIVLSDNGAFMIPGRGLGAASNAPLRDGGNTTYEGGVRVPFIARWPGRFPAGSLCREPLTHLDLAPMILRAAGARPPNGVFDGRDATDVLAGQTRSPHEYLFFQFEGWLAVRAGRYKLVRSEKTGQRELYDLERDLGETTDLAAQRPQVAQRLDAALSEWRRNFSKHEVGR